MTSDCTKPKSNSAYTPTPCSSAFCLMLPLDRPPTASGSSFLLHNAWGAARENHGTDKSEALGTHDQWPCLGPLFHPRVGPPPGLTFWNDCCKPCPLRWLLPFSHSPAYATAEPFLLTLEHAQASSLWKLPPFSQHPWLASYWQSSPSHHSYISKGCLHQWCPICVASTLHDTPNDV